MTARPPFVPEAVVFDLDGLLVDSEGLWARAEARVVTDLGHRWDPAMQRLMLGKGPRDAAEALAAHLGVDDLDGLEQRLEQATLDSFSAGAPPRPGAPQLVRALAGWLPLGVATNSRRALVDLTLGASGLARHIDAVVTVDDVPAPKPAPDVYATACARLRVDPERSVAFEDSPVGVASARAAGLWVVGCPSLPGQRLDGADVVIDSLEDVDPRQFAAAA